MNMAAEKGTQRILVCGDKKRSLAAAFASFELLLRRDEMFAPQLFFSLSCG